MYVYAAQIFIALPTRSLKGKRGIVKSILGRARNRFNVAVAEVDRQDDPEHAHLAFVSVSPDRLYARQLLEKLEEWLVDERPDVDVTAVDIGEW
jgi:hypothetical protein